MLDSISLARGRSSARHLVDQYPTFDLVLRLSAAQATLAIGDTAAALRNLAYFDIWSMNLATIPVSVLSPIADYQLARIAQAQGRSADARLYYEQLLAIYTHPPAGQLAMVEDARTQLARLEGLREPSS